MKENDHGIYHLTIQIVVLALVGAAVALPAKLDEVEKKEPVAILSSFVEQDGANTKFGFKSADGIEREGQVVQKQIGTESGSSQSGSVAFTGADGVPVSWTFVADENGFQPSPNILPVAPEPSPAIKRALEQIRRTIEADKKRDMMLAAAAAAARA